MLVPVSPSGTGYTFSRSIAERCRTSRSRKVVTVIRNSVTPNISSSSVGIVPEY